jgi:hypothetical protein
VVISVCTMFFVLMRKCSDTKGREREREREREWAGVALSEVRRVRDVCVCGIERGAFACVRVVERVV